MPTRRFVTGTTADNPRMDPPEMEMRQLLLVSSIGLGINLFGMWATGGHHHHGHSHGGHDHGHGHVHHKKVSWAILYLWWRMS